MHHAANVFGNRLPAVRSVAGILVLLFAWWVASSNAGPASKLPDPIMVGQAWIGLLDEGVLLQGLIGTSRSFLAAWVLAGALGLSIGLLMALSRSVRDALTPVIEILRPIPSAAIIPLAIVLVGLSDQMKISVATYAALWPVLMTAAAALARIDEQLVHMCRQFGLRGRLNYLLRVQMPSASPEILTALRTSSVIALALTITTELVASGDGLGNWIVRYEQATRVPEMYACIVTVMIFGSVAYAAAVALERRLIRWSVKPQ